MTGADMGFEPMISPARRKMAMALSRPSITQPAQAMREAAMPAPGMPTMAPDTTDHGADDLYPGGEKNARGGNEDPSKDLRSFSGLGEYFNDPDVQKNGRALMDMVTGVSPAISGFNMATGGYRGMGPVMDRSLDVERGFDFSPAQTYDGGDWSGPATDPNAGGGEYGGLGGNRDGGFYKGGMVGPEDLMARPVIHREMESQWDNGDAMDPGEDSETMRWNNSGFQAGGVVTESAMVGPDPRGPDQGFVAVRKNEAILTPEQQKKVGRERIARALMGSR